MRRWTWVVVVAVVAAILGWTVWRPAALETSDPARPGATKEAAGRTDTSPAVNAPPRAPAAKPARHGKRVSKEEHAALRERIAKSLAARQDAPKAPAAPAAAPRSADDDAPGDPAGGVQDRTEGELAYLMGTINEDFIPLADECVEQAREADPQLRGMLDLEVSIMADEELGGLVDAVDWGKENEITDPQLTECIRETMLSTVFPQPEGSGQTEVRLTLRLEPDDAG